MIRICLLLCLIFKCGCLLAQDIGRQQMIDSSAVRYSKIAGNQSVLYYGKIQDGHPNVTNHPYLKDAHYAKARLSYYGIIYPDAMLRLDKSRDELVILSPDQRHIVLFPENVDFAELHDQRIIYFRGDTLSGAPSSGYFILLHSGNCRVLEKNNAYLMHDNNGEWFYQISTQFYLYKDGVYHNIRNKSGLLKLLKPYKKELKRFIFANRLQFRHGAGELISRTVGEYEKLCGTI